MLQEFLSLFKAPITGIKEVSEKEKILKILIKLGVVSFITSLLVLIRLLILNGNAGSNSYAADYLKIKGGAIFGMMVLSFVLFAGFIALVAVTIMLLGRIFKANISYKTSLALATNYSYMLGIANILAFITSLFSVTLTFMLLFVGAMYYNLALTVVVRSMLNVEKENKVFWISFGMKAALFLIMYLILWISTKIIGDENMGKMIVLAMYGAAKSSVSSSSSSSLLSSFF